MAHSYFLIRELEEGIEHSRAFVQEEFGLSAIGNPDVMTLRHGHMSVDDARKLRALAELAPVAGDTKVMIISASRLFHEAQNALLKLFEEPPAGTVLILILPAEGMLLPTLRSRLVELPHERTLTESINGTARIELPIVSAFLAAKSAEREKLIAKLLDRTKADKDEEKQAARLEAVQLLEGLVRAAHEKWHSEKSAPKKESFRQFLDGSSAFLPILHERSAPLKLIFEHTLLTIPF